MAISTHLDAIRQEMPATTGQVYLNSGTFGPIPTVVLEAMQTRMNEEWQKGRLGPESFTSIGAIYNGAREGVARLLHATKDEIALTDNTGEGMNIVCYGFNWQAGDEIITTDHEHISGLAPLYQIRDRSGVIIRSAELGERGERPAAQAIEGLITPRTRLIALSHVLWTTGAVLDVQAVARLAHQHGIPVLIDGAQSAGNIALDVKELEVDFYAIPMQKWLCGPDGTGALYIRKESRQLIQPTYVGYYSMDWGKGEAEWTVNSTAQGFELGGRQTAAIAGQQAVLNWLETVVGYPWLFERTRVLNMYLYNAIKDLPGVTVFTPQPGEAGILSFKMEGRNDGEIVKELQEKHSILIRNIPPTGLLRVSTSFYTSEEDIDRLVEALRGL